MKTGMIIALVVGSIVAANLVNMLADVLSALQDSLTF